MKITNEHQIDLPLAVWLLQDGYNSGAEDAPEGELISATRLLKPTKQLILSLRVDQSDLNMDISSLIPSRMGHGLHDSFEKAWTKGNWKKAMKRLGYPDKIINNIVINPDPEDVKEEQIPIYLEKRGFKEFEDVVITGQLDFLIGKSYRDFKTTSVFSYMSGSKDEDYIIQGSIYRWLFPHLVTNDVMRIEFLFTDWQKFMAKNNPKYPQVKITHKEYSLMSLEDTEKWISNKLNEIRTNAKKPQDKMVLCTDKELWRGEDSYKYFSDPEKAKSGGRCTKRFDSPTDAELHLKSRGKGVIVREPGKVKACEYCSAFPICEQRKWYFNDDGTPI